MIRKAIFTCLFIGSLVVSHSAESTETNASLWRHDIDTANGRHYLSGFVRGYIEGRRWGIDMMEGILPYAQIDPSSGVNKKQLESRFFLETVHYRRAVEEPNLQNIIRQVTQWYQDPRNRDITWTKLVDLSIGKVNGFHSNYVEHQLRWLQQVSTQKRIDWFHTIDPATGEGKVTYHDETGRILRVEWVK
jgi:hypothetical protein